MKKLISLILEPLLKLSVSLIPLRILNKLIKFFPKQILLNLSGYFTFTRVYKVLLFDKEFLLESGPSDDHYLDLEKSNLHDWETDALSVWAREVANAEMVIDIGAYLGVFSILAAKLGCRKVLAIEPNSKNFSSLQRNLTLNDLDGLVISHKLAVGATSRLVSVITPNGRPNSSGSQIVDSPTGRNLNFWEMESEVQMVTLDSMLVDETAHISVIKIDAEGYELLILQGGIKTLITHSPCMLIELLDDKKKSEADYFLSDFGYSKGLPIETSGLCTNFLYKK
jgi:FkbM family methyltransferase